MAPAATQSPPNLPEQAFSYHNPSSKIFPDGIKTAGQTNPIYDQIRPYSEFPKEITGPTAWDAAEYKNNPERWTHVFSEEEIEEISKAADDFIASSTPLTGITKVCLIADGKYGQYIDSLRTGEIPSALQDGRSA